MRLEPYGPRVVVTDPPAQDRRIGEIVLPPSAGQLRRMLVVAVGPDVDGLEPGDVVWFDRQRCRGLEAPGSGQLVIEATCIYAIERDE